MTQLPSSGPLSYNNFNTAAGRASGTNIDMAWIYNNTKSGQQSYALGSYYGRAWYQRNVDGNCNNGNCNCGNCNCGNINCVNCFGFQCINCTNCDTRSWFQNNCNCACTYNCNFGVWSVNCDCACTCFPADALVVMADGTYKRIEDIKIGDKVAGGHGMVNTVIAYHEAALGNQPIYIINGKHRTTGEHRHWTTDGWAALDLSVVGKSRDHELTVDNNGRKEIRKGVTIKESKVVRLKKGMHLITANGPELIESIEVDWNQDPKQYVYTLVCDGSHVCLVNDVYASAWATDADFDYNTWTPKLALTEAA